MKNDFKKLYGLIKDDDFIFSFLLYSGIALILLSATWGSAVGYKYGGKTLLSALDGLWRGALGGLMVCVIIHFFFRLMNWLFSSILMSIWKRFSGWIIFLLIITIPLIFGILLSRFL